jgi:hypothetical protein
MELTGGCECSETSPKVFQFRGIWKSIRFAIEFFLGNEKLFLQ